MSMNPESSQGSPRQEARPAGRDSGGSSAGEGQAAEGLLSGPPAASGAASFVITVPHAWGTLPHWLDHLASASAWLAVADSHHALDRYVVTLARTLAPLLDAPLIEGEFSRLLVDPNRALDDPTSIVAAVEGEILPFNLRLARGDLAARRSTHWAFHHEVEKRLGDAGPGPVYLIDLHSFDRHGLSLVPREVDIGVCAPGDNRFALGVLDVLRRLTTPRGARERVATESGRLNARLDEPYSAAHPGAYIMRRHGPAARGGIVIEVCDDLLVSEAAIGAVAQLLAQSLVAATEATRQPDPHPIP